MLLDVAREHDDVLSDPSPEVLLCDFGDNSANLELRVWTVTRLQTPHVLRSDHILRYS